jgi:manganese transport protein
MHRFGFRSFEAVVIALVATIGVCYVIEIASAHDLIRWPVVLRDVFVPALPPRPVWAPPNTQSSLLVAIGMLGATVMPHNLFLHSGVIKTRVGMEDNTDTPGRKDVHTAKVVRFALLDSLLALNIAWLVNSAMIVVAAATFFAHQRAIDDIQIAYETLRPLLGDVAPAAFGIALLAAGLSSSVTGTLASQIVMEGFLKRDVPLWLLRLFTMIPAFIIIGLMNKYHWGSTQILVVSQVCLSLALPFAVIPLLMFTRRRDLMREHVNKPLTNTLAYLAAAVILILNALLLWQSFGGPLPF